MGSEEKLSYLKKVFLLNEELYNFQDLFLWRQAAKDVGR